MPASASGPKIAAATAQGDLGLVAVIGNAADDLVFHDLVLIYHQSTWLVFKAGKHLHPDPMVHRQLDRAGLQHLGTQRRHLQHLFIRDSGQFLGARYDARVARVNAIDIGEDIAAIRLQSSRQRHSRRVGAAAAQCGNPPGLADALETGDNRHDAIGHTREQHIRLHLNPHTLQHDSHQAAGHLFAAGDHSIVFARVVHGRGLLHQADQPVGLAGHRRDDDGNLIAGIDGPFNPNGRIANPVKVSDGSAAEFLYNTGHGLAESLVRNECANYLWSAVA